MTKGSAFVERSQGPGFCSQNLPPCVSEFELDSDVVIVACLSDLHIHVVCVWNVPITDVCIEGLVL